MSEETENPLAQPNLRGLFLPKGPFKQGWDLVILILLIYTAVYAPIQVAFVEETSNVALFFELAVDIIFLADVCVTFNTTYYVDDGLLETSRKAIAVRYLRGWFLLDLVTALPFQLLEIWADEGGAEDVKLARMSRLPRLYKLMRLVRMIKVLRLARVQAAGKFPTAATFVRRHVDVTAAALLQVFMVIIFLNHLMACIWYAQAKYGDFPSDCWVVARGLEHDTAPRLYL